MTESDPSGLPLPNNSPSPGRLLRDAREERGIGMAEFASTIKVPQPKLEMLEADDWAALPSIAFTRALALTVCRELSLDPAPVMSLLPLTDVQRIEQVSVGLNTPYRERSLGSLVGSWGSLNRPVIWLSLLLLLAAYGLYKMPGSEPARQEQLAVNAPPSSGGGAAQPPSDPASASLEPTVDLGVASPPLEPASGAQQPAIQPSEAPPFAASQPATPQPATPQSATPQPAAPQPAVSQPAVPQSAAAQPVIQPPAEQPSAVQSPRLQEPPPPKPAVRVPPASRESRAEPSPKPAAPSGAKSSAVDPLGELVASLEAKPEPVRRLELRATSPSWVGVYDAHGKLLFNQVLRPGSVSVVQGGALPLRLRIGNASGTQVKFRGRVVDLAPSTKDNVARIQLN